MSSPTHSIASDADLRLVAALRAGDEDVFRQLVDAHNASMLRIAGMYVGDERIAEEVLQETWLAVLQSIRRFEGRSSFKTWLFTILTNRAKTRAVREGRYVALNLEDESDDDGGIPSNRFTPSDYAAYPDHWTSDGAPHPWEKLPEEYVLARETRETIAQAIDMLPFNQREVIRMRDVEGFTSDEVCNILNISETNQRVLLHRARTRVRQAIEVYFSEQ